jgi:hypothetical protein
MKAVIAGTVSSSATAAPGTAKLCRLAPAQATSVAKLVQIPVSDGRECVLQSLLRAAKRG